MAAETHDWSRGHEQETTERSGLMNTCTTSQRRHRKNVRTRGSGCLQENHVVWIQQSSWTVTIVWTHRHEFTQVGKILSQRVELRMKFHLLPRNCWPLLAAERGRANFLLENQAPRECYTTKDLLAAQILIQGRFIRFTPKNFIFVIIHCKCCFKQFAF